MRPALVLLHRYMGLLTAVVADVAGRSLDRVPRELSGLVVDHDDSYLSHRPRAHQDDDSA